MTQTHAPGTCDTLDEQYLEIPTFIRRQHIFPAFTEFQKLNENQKRVYLFQAKHLLEEWNKTHEAGGSGGLSPAFLDKYKKYV